MHWAVIPLLVTAVSAAAVEPAAETAAAETDREGKCKKYIVLSRSKSSDSLSSLFQCSASFKLSNLTTKLVMRLTGRWEPATRPRSALT